MTDELMTTPDAEDIALLRAAAKKLKDNAMPHVISEDRWVERSGSNKIRGVLYKGDRYINIIENVTMAKDVLFPRKRNKEFWDALKFDEGTSKLRDFLINLRVAATFLVRTNLDIPDAEVDGNIFPWGEHGTYAAMWSPEVSKALQEWLEAEADARESGFATSASEHAIVLARKIVDKKLYDDQPVFVPFAPPLWSDFLAHASKSALAERRRRGKRLSDAGVPFSHMRFLSEQFGYMPAPLALRHVSKLRAEYVRKYANSKPSTKEAYREMLTSIEKFITIVKDKQPATPDSYVSAAVEN